MTLGAARVGGPPDGTGGGGASVEADKEVRPI